MLISPDDITKTYGESLGNADITGAAINGNNPEVDVAGVWSFVSAYNPTPLCADSGTYTVRFSPTDTFNYQDPDDVTLTLTVNKRDITIASVLGVNRAFNGETLVQLSGGTLQNLVYSDTITFTLGTGNTASPDAADYTVGNLNIQIHGDRVVNYHLIQPTDVTVTILPKDVNGAVTIADIAPYYYTTLAHTPTPVVTDNALSVALVSGIDMTYSYSNNVNASTTATVTANGTGNYTGTESKTFTILKSNVNLDANDVLKTYGESFGHADVTGTAKNANNTSVNVVGAWAVSSSFNPTPLCADSGTYSVSFTPTDSSNYNTPDDTTLTLTVEKRVITIVGVYGVERPFNGYTTVDLAGGTLQNLVYSDPITVTQGTASISDPDIGPYTVFNYTILIGGERAVNYTLIQPTGIEVTIVPKDVAGAVTIAD
ncbi:MAG: hypothetical protein EOM14_14835, partial [Clostridia bacterium]|nr:hypothetical protein [Clostridia bacterium]